MREVKGYEEEGEEGEASVIGRVCYRRPRATRHRRVQPLSPLLPATRLHFPLPLSLFNTMSNKQELLEQAAKASFPHAEAIYKEIISTYSRSAFVCEGIHSSSGSQHHQSLNTRMSPNERLN